MSETKDLPNDLTMVLRLKIEHLSEEEGRPEDYEMPFNLRIAFTRHQSDTGEPLIKLTLSVGSQITSWDMPEVEKSIGYFDVYRSLWETKFPYYFHQVAETAYKDFFKSASEKVFGDWPKEAEARWKWNMHPIGSYFDDRRAEIAGVGDLRKLPNQNRRKLPPLSDDDKKAFAEAVLKAHPLWKFLKERATRLEFKKEEIGPTKAHETYQSFLNDCDCEPPPHLIEKVFSPSNTEPPLVLALLHVAHTHGGLSQAGVSSLNKLYLAGRKIIQSAELKSSKKTKKG